MSEESKYTLNNESRVGVIGAGPAGSFFSYFLLDIAERIDMLESDINSKFDQTIKELQRLELSSAQQKAPRPETTQPPEAGKQDIKPQVHNVQAGETIYRISRRYGLTVEQLRNFNKLGPNAKIYPGQELKLAP